MAEKRIRRTQAEVERLVTRVTELVSAGTPVTRACEQVGLQPASYRRHKDTASISSPKVSSQVQKLLVQLTEAIRKQVREEIKASL